MTQSRTIPAATAADLERDSSPYALIWFLTITHPALSEPIPIVSDVFNYELGGVEYIGIPFDAIVVTDNDQQPTAQLRVQNINRRIGQALESMDGRAGIYAVAYSAADFDLSVDPRAPTGTPSAVYTFSNFSLSDVDVNAAEVTGRISLLVDYSQEPWPYIRATQDRFPGLFR